MRFPILSRDTAPAASRPILDGIAADLGFVPNFAAVIAASPTLLAGFDGLRRAVGGADFDPVRREIAGLAVGVAVGNSYGVAFHSTVLGRLGVDSSDIDAMRSGGEPADTIHAAVYAFARALVIDRGAISHDVARRVADAGLESDDLLQLVAECAFATLVGLVDNLAGGVELDEFLRRQAWK
jgi:alkylhydroperoxidase family enzyme